MLFEITFMWIGYKYVCLHFELLIEGYTDLGFWKRIFTFPYMRLVFFFIGYFSSHYCRCWCIFGNPFSATPFLETKRRIKKLSNQFIHDLISYHRWRCHFVIYKQTQFKSYPQWPLYYWSHCRWCIKALVSLQKSLPFPSKLLQVLKILIQHTFYGSDSMILETNFYHKLYESNDSTK